ncbi:MAG: hypothetical protein AAGI11_07970 [Pseudomonadota bacterium]
MSTHAKKWAPVLAGAAVVLCLPSAELAAEGSRSLHPASYPAAGARSNLDLQSGRYVNRISRRAFNYVYAEAGEYILLGSSNLGSSGDIDVYNPQDFGIPGDETRPSTVDFSCTGGTVIAGDHYFGAGLGEITSRARELAGPNSANNTNTVSDGWAPCVYQAPTTGVYGVQFDRGTGSGPNGDVDTTPSSNRTSAAWDITVRESATSLVDLDGRVFTYAFVGFTGGNSRPVFSTLYYVTADGYRYRQDLRGLDPNGYALYANTFGFLDNGEPIYKTLRGNNAQVDNLPAGVTAAAAQFPIFFSDISPGGAAEGEAERVLSALGLPREPPSPQISNVAFDSVLGDDTTSTGVGGTFSFDTTGTVSYEIVIRGDLTDTEFDPANPLNATLTGIAFSGTHTAEWDGRDNNGDPMPASATPYDYRAFGRNGEVHFPIIDAENNGAPASAVPGGGPTITRLNGTLPGDTTVFFDDRGYVTASGETVGILNGFLCGAAAPAAADPAVSLTGVDSTTVYRRWGNGGNSNSDCSSSAGWGDAKGVNLWTYFLTPEFSRELTIVESQIDVATSVATVATVEAGDEVVGVFAFGNNGVNTANGVTYSMMMTPGLGTVNFGNLPPGVNASYDNGSGVVTLTGLPDTLAPGQFFNGLTFSYTAPVSGPVEVSTAISTTDIDDVPQNNTADAITIIGSIDLATEINGVREQGKGGSTVTGSVVYSHLGIDNADGVTYELSIGEPDNTVTDVMFINLPVGVSAVYNADGTVTFTGMPTTLTPGAVLSVSFSYTGPPEHNSSIPIEASITTTSNDANPLNDSDSANTVFTLPDLSTEVVTLPTSGEPNSIIAGTVRFANQSGIDDAEDVTYSLSIGGPGNTVTDLVFTDLPVGASAVYNADGTVTLSGMPETLLPGDTLDVSFTYTSPMADASTIPVNASISTSCGDSNPANDADNGDTSFSFSVGAAIDVNLEALCINDVPYLRYTITPVGFTPTSGATLELVGSDLAVAQSMSDQPLSGTMLWPGAEVDNNGVGIAWPGWELVDGEWQEVPSTVRPEIILRAFVNPSAEVSATYPPSTLECSSSPPGERLSDHARSIPTLPLPLLLLTALAAMLLGVRGQRA